MPKVRWFISCSRNAIYTVRNIVGDYASKGNAVNLCAVDLAKAFDKVNHNVLYIKTDGRTRPIAVSGRLTRSVEIKITDKRRRDSGGDSEP